MIGIAITNVFENISQTHVSVSAGQISDGVEMKLAMEENLSGVLFLRVQHLQRVYRKEASRPMMRNSECAGLPVIWKILEAEKPLKVKRI